MPQFAIDKTRVRMTSDGEVIVPFDIWEQLLKLVEDGEGWETTAHLLKSAKNRQRLMNAIKEIEEGYVESHDLIEG